MTGSPTNPADHLTPATIRKLLSDPDVYRFLMQSLEIPAPTAPTQTIPAQNLQRAEETIRRWKTKLADSRANADPIAANQIADWLFAAAIVLGNLGLHELAEQSFAGVMERAP